MMGSKKRGLSELERKYDALLAEKMELEYRCKSLESEHAREIAQKEEILSLHENARRLKHDMRNHVMVIAAYLQQEQVEEAKTYLSKILDQLKGMYSHIEIGNSLTSHVLNRKLQSAQEQGIQIKAQIENLAFARMESVDFVSVLSNLLDNAIQGASCPPGAARTLSVTIAGKRGYETILVKNSIAQSVLAQNPDLRSTKEQREEHGVGVNEIRRIVEKYDGICQFYEEENTFCAAVMIPSVVYPGK